MIGKKYHRLTVIGRSAKNLNGKRYWHCMCDCGQTTVTYTGALTTGNTKSCGCLVKETSRRLIVEARKHLHVESHGHSIGGKTSPTYQSWRAMKQRCYCENNKDYHNYGGKGIHVCIEWLDSFNTFLVDMGERPSKDYSLDRIDPEQHYCQSNCQWLLKSENSSKGNAQRKLRNESLGKVGDWL